jgi:hypothetical protein
MEKEIAKGNIGSVGDYKLEFKDGKLRAEAAAKPIEGVSSGAFLELDSDALMNLVEVTALAKVKAAIPGQVDDFVVDLIFNEIKKALKA